MPGGLFFVQLFLKELHPRLHLVRGRIKTVEFHRHRGDEELELHAILHLIDVQVKNPRSFNFSIEASNRAC